MPSSFINFSELYNAGGSFAKQEVTVSGSTTTIYGGYSPIADPAAAASAPNWIIRKTTVTENGTTQTIVTMWARGSWDDRATLTYQYSLPGTPNMYAEPQPPLP